MRQPWRGHRAPAPEPEAPGDPAQSPEQILRAAAAICEPLARGGLARKAPWAASGIVRRVQRAAAAGARRASWEVSRAARRAPWPLGALARAGADLISRGAERLDPTPPGAGQAEYLSAALAALAGNPRRAALRDAAAAYAADLSEALPVESFERASAEALRAALSDWSFGDSSTQEPSKELIRAAAGLRPGSPGRLAVERAAADTAPRVHHEVYWSGTLVPISHIKSELRLASNFWAAYAAGSDSR